MASDGICISFKIEKAGQLFAAKNKTETVMSCTFVGGRLDFSIIYDFKPDEPLKLAAYAEPGDEIKINLLPHRLELYVGDVLADEEWPFGKHFLKDDRTDFIGDFDMFDCTERSKEIEPDILSVFYNAEGWKPEKNVFVGDCMPYVHDGRYHVLYLKDRHHHKSKWGIGAHQWSHISTDDFVKWCVHPTAIEIDASAEGSICTGSWIFDDKKHYLFYTVRTCDGTPAKICRSISDDGIHFEKDRSFCFSLSERYIAASARDPKLVKDESGVYHMILTTSLAESGKGCLAHLTSTDMLEWIDEKEPLLVFDTQCGEPECPDYFYKDGFYYIVYSLHAKGYYMYSKQPFSGWITPKNPIIPCKSVPKAGIWKNRLIFAGFDGNGSYGGTMTFLEADVQKDGELCYKNND